MCRDYLPLKAIRTYTGSMNISSLLNQFNIPAWQESETLEWKLSTREAKEIVQSAVAFSNCAGGLVVCGVQDDGSIVGQDISDATLREVSQTILANSAERLYPSIERVTVEGKSVLLISVPSSPLKPHTAYGRPYKRVGSTNAAMDQTEYHRLLGSKMNGGGADRDICPDASMADIDEARLKRFVEIANDKRNLNLSLFADPLQILESLELAQGGALNKGAILLFGRKPQRFVAAAELRAAHFENDRREVFLTQRVFEGDLFQQFEAALQFVRDRLSTRIQTTLSGDRVQAKLPMLALQELVANALVHRDYRDAASTYLNITAEQEIEINNPGALPAPRITPEYMLLPHPSMPTNRRIARVFFLAGIIEQWGEGARRAGQALIESGLAAPVWTSERGTVRVVIKL